METTCWRGPFSTRSARPCRNWPLRQARATIPSRQRCAELLALTPWDEYQSAADMVDMTSAKTIRQPVRPRPAARPRHVSEGTTCADWRSTPEAIQAAWRTYEAALAKAPDDWSLHRHFGRLAMQFGRPDVAVEHFRIAVERVPWDASMHNDLGNALAAQGRIDEAIAQYQAALEINPDDMEAHFNLGVVLAGRGQVDEAIARYRKALEIGPDFVAAHVKLALSLAGRGQVDEAIAHYQKALEIKPDWRWPTTTSAMLCRPRTGRRGHRPLPQGAGNQARLRGGPQQPRFPSVSDGTGRRGDRPVSARPWKSSPTSPKPTTTSASCLPAADSSTRPSPIFRRRWKSSPTCGSGFNKMASIPRRASRPQVVPRHRRERRAGGTTGAAAHPDCTQTARAAQGAKESGGKP